MMNRRQFMQVAGAGAAATVYTRPAAAQVTRPIRLFNGKDLTNFYTFLRTKGKNNDPDKVFSVVDGMIRVSGTEFGQFMTEQEFENYRLTFDFKWGAETHPPRKDRARDSGCLYHCVGPDKVWHRSIEYQIIEGGTGDIILVDGAVVDWNESMRVQLAGGTISPFGTLLLSGRLNWYKRSPEWKDVINFRGKDDVEKPAGHWNHAELIADGRRAVHVLNGVEVNELSGANPAKGKILFQSEGAEIFFKNIVLHPVKK
jgi:hypothetical protein